MAKEKANDRLKGGVVTDPIGDLLTRIRNGLGARHAEVRLPHSRLKARIAEILVKEGYLDDVDVVSDPVQSEIVIKLKYAAVATRSSRGLKRVSKPGLRVYAGRRQPPARARRSRRRDRVDVPGRHDGQGSPPPQGRRRSAL